MTLRTTTIRRAGAVLLCVACLVTLATAQVARAGEWAQVSCVNPGGSASNAQGWSGDPSGPNLDGEVSATCSPAQPLQEQIDTGVTAFSSETLEYDPPAGSTIAGGTLSLSGTDQGYGDGAETGTVLYYPAPVYPGDAQFRCIEGQSSPCAADDDSFSHTTVTLPADAGGVVDLQLACTGESGQSCATGASSDGADGVAEISSAQILLDNNSVPAASGFSGTLLSPNEHGGAHLLFTATDPDGPGVYQVSASIDGTLVYLGTPDSEDGACAPVGTYPGSSALEFDFLQPCPQTVSVDIPVNTATLADGSHDLTVKVFDAAGNVATVLDRYISTRNPVTTPVPRATRTRARPLSVRFALSARWRGPHTRLLSLTSSAVPGDASVAAAVSGPHHPRIALTHERAGGTPKLLRALTRLTFSAGDRLVLEVRAPHRAAEKILISFRNGRVPLAVLVAG